MARRRGEGQVPTLERMARLGVLGRWIPAFAQVSGRLQFDLFHVYTVDQHTLAVLRNLASFGQAAPEDDRFATARAVWPTLRKRSEEHTSELQSLMRISYAVFCLKNKK